MSQWSHANPENPLGNQPWQMIEQHERITRQVERPRDDDDTEHEPSPTPTCIGGEECAA